MQRLESVATTAMAGKECSVFGGSPFAGRRDDDDLWILEPLISIRRPEEGKRRRRRRKRRRIQKFHGNNVTRQQQYQDAIQRHVPHIFAAIFCSCTLCVCVCVCVLGECVFLSLCQHIVFLLSPGAFSSLRHPNFLVYFHLNPSLLSGILSWFPQQ